MNPLVEALFAIAVEKALDKAGEVLDEALGKLPPDTDVLIQTPELWLQRHRANRALRELKIECLENLDKLSLICRALWTLVRQYCNFSEDQVKDKISPLKPHGKQRIKLRPGAGIPASDTLTKLADIWSEAPRSSITCQQLSIGLNEKMERLAVISRAIWELLHETFGFSDEDLLNKVTELDLRDGRLDGKLITPAKKCSKCGKVVSRKHMKYLYCGEENLLDSAFDSLISTVQFETKQTPEQYIMAEPLWNTVSMSIAHGLALERPIPPYQEVHQAENAAAQEIYQAKNVTASLRGYKATLRDEIDKLALVYRAIWELFRDKKGLSERDLHDMVRELDLRDGILDGKIRTPPKKCSKCGRVVSQRHLRCMYCGSQELEDSPFDSV